MSPGAYYPPPSFFFRLQFSGISALLDNAFQEASGLSAEWDVETVHEGGRNNYAHRLPKAVKYQNLVLRRGFVTTGSELADWCKTSLSTDFANPLVLRNIQLHLLDPDAKPLSTWTFREAWPVKWSMSEFRSQENALAIETLEFAFADCKRVSAS